MTVAGIRADKAQAEDLRQGASLLGVELSGSVIDKFMLYLAELKRWGAKMNLTARADETEIISRHFLDSLTLLPTLRGLGCKKILDMGSGAGFPGLPLKIAAPELDITLMDAREKRVFFLRHLIRSLGLSTGISAIKGRAEVIPQGLAAAFDCVTSRAFSHLSAFLPLAMPYLMEKGFIIAMKGPKGPEELKGLDTAGLEGPRIVRTHIPGSDRETLLMTFKMTDKASKD